MLLIFGIKPLAKRQLESVSVAAAMSGKVPAMPRARMWGVRLDLVVKKRLAAQGRRDDGGFVLSSSVATSVAKASFLFCFFFRRPEPAAGAQVGLVFGG